VTPWTVSCQAPLSMGISQARIPESVAISFSRGTSQPRDQTQVSCIADRFFIPEPLGKPHIYLKVLIFGRRRECPVTKSPWFSFVLLSIKIN